jgi:hypothetical protein
MLFMLLPKCMPTDNRLLLLALIPCNFSMLAAACAPQPEVQRCLVGSSRPLGPQHGQAAAAAAGPTHAPTPTTPSQPASSSSSSRCCVNACRAGRDA